MSNVLIDKQISRLSAFLVLSRLDDVTTAGNYRSNFSFSFSRIPFVSFSFHAPDFTLESDGERREGEREEGRD